MSTKKTFYIVDGPTKKRLFDSLYYSCDENVTFTVHFTLQTDKMMSNHSQIGAYFIITALQLEDGSGGSFNFEGYQLCDGTKNGPRKKAKGYYHANQKVGHIVIDQD